jgi:hypothetical protein
MDLWFVGLCEFAPKGFHKSLFLLQHEAQRVDALTLQLSQFLML